MIPRSMMAPSASSRSVLSLLRRRWKSSLSCNGHRLVQQQQKQITKATTTTTTTTTTAGIGGIGDDDDDVPTARTPTTPTSHHREQPPSSRYHHHHHHHNHHHHEQPQQQRPQQTRQTQTKTMEWSSSSSPTSLFSGTVPRLDDHENDDDDLLHDDDEISVIMGGPRRDDHHHNHPMSSSAPSSLSYSTMRLAAESMQWRQGSGFRIGGVGVYGKPPPHWIPIPPGWRGDGLDRERTRKANPVRPLSTMATFATATEAALPSHPLLKKRPTLGERARANAARGAKAARKGAQVARKGAQTAGEMIRQYGPVFLGTYFGVYLATLGTLFAGVDAGYIDPLTLMTYLQNLDVLHNVGGVGGDAAATVTIDAAHAAEAPSSASSSTTANETTLAAKPPASSTVDLVVGWMNRYDLTRPYASVVEQNPHVANFGVAWIAAKFTEPIRLVATMAVVPRLARYMGFVKPRSDDNDDDDNDAAPTHDDKKHDDDDVPNDHPNADGTKKAEK